ncbi:hypothetical protein [Spirillospora sp. CA-294931]|uniref:hypothetical protein n=1 Tax=Spirillospora sp. CA-294931 TaxID=3240042 RepID=UPI003D8D584C
MARIKQFVSLGAATLTVLALAAPPASAAGTTIRKGSATADPYEGKVQAVLLGTASVSTSLGGGTCNRSTMAGTTKSDGTALDISAASFTNDPGPACGDAAVTTERLPWTGGSTVFDAAHTGGRDAAVTIANARVKAIAFGMTCYYGGNLTANGFNPDNPGRGDTTVAEAQVSVKNSVVNKQSGSGFLCPSTATVTANYKLLGEKTAGSGVFDQTLYVTG